MGFLKGILNFFLSLRTALWLLTGICLFLVFGSFIMPFKEEFQTINFQPLFAWLAKNPVSVAWWLWAALFLLCLLTVNTLFCSVESVLRKSERKKRLLIISPQISHAGFLFILLAHLASSIGGMKGNVVVHEGSRLVLPNGITLQVEKITAEMTPEGYASGYSADIRYLSEGIKFKEDKISPNKPSFYKGLGVYIKNIELYPAKTVLLEVSREPGALWALIGSIFFTAGTVMLVALKMGGKRED